MSITVTDISSEVELNVFTDAFGITHIFDTMEFNSLNLL